MITMEAIEAYRTADGREEHHARKEALQNEIENTREFIEELHQALKLCQKAGSGFIPWEIEDAFAEYTGTKARSE